MLMKKGKYWAMSCVAVSAAVLVGLNTPVQADSTSDNNAVTTSSIASTASTQSSSTTKSNNEDVQDGGNIKDDYPDVSKNVLGYASKFHVFAKEASLNAHTNGNVAVEQLYGNVNFGTNIHEKLVNKDISYVQKVNNMASSSFVGQTDGRTNKVIFGADEDVDVSNTTRTNVNGINVDHLTKDETYQDKGTNKYIDFDNYFKTLENTSTDLAQKDPQVTVKNSDFPDANQRVINLENYQPNANNQIIINLDPDVLTSGTPLTIAGLSKDSGGTNIVINVDTNGQENYVVNSQIKLIYNDGSSQNERPNQETEYFDDNHLLWNFYDSTASDKLYDGTLTIDRPFQGSVLAPNATIDVNQNLDGNIVAENVNVNAETHRWDYQDQSGDETHYEIAVTIPGELPFIPGEEDNNGSNITNPDEEEEEDIDPDTGDLIEVDGGSEAEKPDTGDNGSEEEDNSSNEENSTEDNKDNSKEDNDTEDKSSEGNLITNGGSENTDNSSDLDAGVLPSVVGNSNDESQTPTTDTSSKNESGTLPQTGETTGILITMAGLILLAFSFVLKATRIKKEN